MLADQDTLMEPAEARFESSTGGATGWDSERQEPPVILSQSERDDWLDIRGTLAMLAKEQGWSMGEVSRRADVAGPTLSGWYSGKYKGRFAPTTAKIRLWIRSHEEGQRAGLTLTEPGFIRTRVAKEVLEAMMIAQHMPGIALVTLAPGLGKTSCLQEALRTRPHCYAVTASPSVKTVPMINREIASVLDLSLDPRGIKRRIGERLHRNNRQSLLIIDEAQNLSDAAADELRGYLDIYKVGLVFLGNEEVLTRWGGHQPRKGYAQQHRRIDTRIRRAKPYPEDIATMIAAWGQTDPTVVKLLTTIAQRPGSFGQIERTLKLASLYAKGGPIKPDDVRTAWDNRAGEEL